MNNFIILIPPSEGKQTGGEEHSITLHPIVTELNPTQSNTPCLPAIKRYTGVLYKALDYNTIKHKKYIDEHVRILSGLFGMITPKTPIPYYKYPITTKAAKKWNEENSKQLTEAFVIDLLPQAHKKSVEYTTGVEIEFTHTKNGKTIRSGHAGKHIKGRYLRWLAQQHITEEKDIYAFREDGYVWNGKTFHKTINQ